MNDCSTCNRSFYDHQTDCVTYLREELDALKTRLALLEGALYNQTRYAQVPQYWQNPVTC